MMILPWILLGLRTSEKWNHDALRYALRKDSSRLKYMPWHNPSGMVARNYGPEGRGLEY